MQRWCGKFNALKVELLYSSVTTSHSPNMKGVEILYAAPEVSIFEGHFTHEPSDRDHEIVRAQKKVSKRPSQHTSKIIYCGHGSSSVMSNHV